MTPLLNSLMVRAADAPVIKPAVELGTPLLLTIAAAGVALLLLMIIRFKIQAFVALLTVSILVAVAAQIPLKDVFTVVATGVGGTMGKVALLIALGAILGRMIEVSGGVQSLADHFTAKLGARRVAVALTAVGFLVAIPVFFEVGIIVLVPIVYAFAKIANVHPVKFGLPMAGIMLAIHVAVPPHPGIVAGAGVLGADIGLIALISLTICVPLGFLSYWVASHHEPQGLRAAARRQSPGGRVRLRHPGPRRPRGPGQQSHRPAPSRTDHLPHRHPDRADPPRHRRHPRDRQERLLVRRRRLRRQPRLRPARRRCALLLPPGRPPAVVAEGNRRDLRRRACLPIASILMVVAAGGVFGSVLQVSGIGKALSESLDTLGVPLLLLGFIISLALRAAQGSATVAIVTTAGLLSSAVAGGGYTPAQIAVIVIAIGFGALGLSHVTDAGFWVVVRYYGLTVADGLRTWTVLTTVLGLAGFALTFVAWILVGGLSA